MCLNIPSKIISRKGKVVKVKRGSHKHEASLELMDKTKLRVGDYVIVQDGYVTQKISKKEAEYILKLLS